MSTGHFIDDRLGGEIWLPTPRDEDREYERARQDEVDAREVAPCCADCGKVGQVYSSRGGPWQCWDCRHPR
jgi:hypothetical protein